MYVTAADSLGAGAAQLIAQNQVANTIIILAIAGAAGGVAFVILRWNRRLDETVSERTSELVAANEILEAKSNAEKDLMNITAHELRTPTQSILANAELLRGVIRPALGLPTQPPEKEDESESGTSLDLLASDIQPSEIVDLVESTYRNAERLQALTRNILEVARIDSKTLSLANQAFDLNELVKESIEDIRVHLPNRNGPGDADSHYPSDLIFAFEPRQPSLFVHADMTRVGEVLGNLLDNAAKFSAKGGRITVTADRSDDKNLAVVRVRDEGKGLDPEILPKLFGKFATKNGTGLGLYISKAFVEAHGGTMQVESEGIMEKGNAKGAVFSFTLPLASSQSMDST